MLKHRLSGFMAVLLVVCAARLEAAQMPDTSKMNILFIDIEDTNAGALACYGNTICKTPNLDKLAATGVRFDRAYVQAMACNPSRTSFLTGLRPLTTRVTRNEHVMNDHLPPGTMSLPELLKQKGFYTADIGKLFHQTSYAERQMASFDRIDMYEKPSGWKGPGPLVTFPAVKRANANPAPADKNSREFRLWKKAQSDRYGDSGLAPQDEGDYRKAVTACALLKDFAKTKKQFFLALSQSRPHTPLLAPKKYLDMYDPARIPAPAAPADKCVKFPYMFRAVGANPDIFTDKPPTDQQARQAIAAYYACVTFVDDNVGMVLGALENEGLADNTIVVFLGDHGFHLGDHGCWSKYSMMEEVRRAPLIIRVPGAPANGKPCTQFVEFVDLVQTLGQLVDLKVPANLEGLSFVPMFVNPDRPWKKAIFMVEDGRGGLNQVVRNHKFSYMEFKKNEVPVALYDLEKDPWEMVNVAEDVAYAAVRKEMAELLRAGWKAGLPDGVVVRN